VSHRSSFGMLLRFISLGAALVLYSLPVAVHADDAWPDRPVRIVAPFPAGGSVDVVARILAQRLGILWKQGVVVDNRPGAGGMIGASVTAKSPADGYTLMLASGSMFTVNQYIYKQLPYSNADFSYITTVASNPMVVAVAPSLPADNLKELIAIGRAHPMQLNFGSAGIGSQVHMADEAFADAAGIQMTHVPYKGEALALNDLMAGRVQVVLSNIVAALPFIKGKTVKALAVTDTHRSSALPDVPTADEAGLPGFDVTGWFALVAPAGTPQNIIDKVQRDTVKILMEADTQKQFAALGMETKGDTPQQLKRNIEAESLKWQRVVRDRHLSAN